MSQRPLPCRSVLEARLDKHLAIHRAKLTESNEQFAKVKKREQEVQQALNAFKKAVENWAIAKADRKETVKDHKTGFTNLIIPSYALLALHFRYVVQFASAFDLIFVYRSRSRRMFDCLNISVYQFICSMGYRHLIL